MVVKLKPFLSYYGGKWKSALRYPPPLYDTICEPFAGSAGYSIRYYTRRVILCDVNPIIAGIWEYLINVKESEFLALPTKFENVNGILPVEARNFIGFWVNSATSTPCKTFSKWAKSGDRPASFWSEGLKSRIANQLKYIRHWEILNESYDILYGQERITWFIDPPYIKMGYRYPYSSIDYGKLAEWCNSLDGQVIVCEADGASWLPFEPFGTVAATPGKNRSGRHKESWWYRNR